MIDQELLLELTESYLKSTISELTNDIDRDFDSFISFGELGIDSFYVLKIIKALESDFGALPKTLLFEYFNINDLAHYFVNKHQQILSEKLIKNQQISACSENASSSPKNTRELNEKQSTTTPYNDKKQQQTSGTAEIILEKDVFQRPDLAALINDLFSKYKNETSVSRGTRNIAPYLFIGKEKQGYFNFSRSGKIILIYAYTGAENYLESMAGEFLQYCTDNNFEFNMFSNEQVDSISGIPFSATPFGVVQRILNLSKFSLKGGAMRRLRYQVSKFEKNGHCKTQEYVSGSEPTTDKNIVKIIEQWCESRTMVNPLIHIVKNEILTGKLSKEHRLFLTYINDELQNVILISSMSGERSGYLMDLEFYPKDMPMGGLEYAIVNIIKILVEEGCDLLSLGGTYGCKLNSSANADPELDKILDDLREQNIFNDSGNLQFKNKFRTENETIYLCREIGKSNPENIIDIIMMIADPSKLDSLDLDLPPPSPTTIDRNSSVESAEKSLKSMKNNELIIKGEERSQILSDFGFNPLIIVNEYIDFDLKTDSWAQLKMPAIDNQMSFLKAQLQQNVVLEESLRSIFPFSYFTLTRSGRDAEEAFYKAWKDKGTVFQNLLFPTGIVHQIDKGFTPEEVPHLSAFDINSDKLFKGNLDLEKLKAKLQKNDSSSSLICIEVNDNAAGGYPVSIEHLKELKVIARQYSIPLVIDGTRVVENALFIIQHENGFADKNLWQVVQEIFSYADVVIASLAKDFCVNKGGIIATNDAALFDKLQQVIYEEGTSVDVIDRKLIALSLQNKKQIEKFCSRRMAWVELIWSALKSADVPVVSPAGGHCVVIDVKQISQFCELEFPVPSFIAWLYLNTGIRAGAHSVGMQRNSSLNNLVRLAIPIGLKREQVDEMVARLIRGFEEKSNIPEIVMSDDLPDSFGDFSGRFELKKYHNASAEIVLKSSMPDTYKEDDLKTKPSSKSTAGIQEYVNSPNLSSVKNSQKQQKVFHEKPVIKDVAIVGMAGRYPKAKNMDEMWENLTQGQDCISQISGERFQRRRQHENAEKYRGGFIDDIDKFDSLFFNISPREAETLDPQERIFLEVAWEALEDAGYYPEVFQQNNDQKVGVFVGAVWTMYQVVGAEERLLGKEAIASSFLWSIANRVSYFMNLTGPSLTVDTACSASLTAIYLANEAIQKGECSSAIVGGVNIDAHQCKQEITVAGGLLSEDGLCHTFGKGANGYVPGEGIGAIFLKPLEQAEKDRDNIYAVIKGININHGGRASGYSVPSSKAQSQLISSVLEKSNIDARSIGYIEAHGTGTELGDPIEISGLTNSFQKHDVDKQSCSIGSVKTNIGHLEAAAGIAGVCKVLLQMKHRKLVPSLHSSELNEHIDFENSPFRVQQNLEEWKGHNIDGEVFPLRAGVSSFGAGGANAHIILEKYQTSQRHSQGALNQSDKEVSVARIVPLSARNEEQLLEMACRLKSYLEKTSAQADVDLQTNLDSVAFTLQVGRKSFEHRMAIIAENEGELLEKLNCYIDGKKDEKILLGHAKNAQGITKLLSRKEKAGFIDLLAKSRNPSKLAQLWIDGLLSDWQGNQSTNDGRRVSLPTYPFADKRHWIANVNNPTVTTQTQARMHPMIDSNESTFERQVFKKTFTEKEFFIYDHLVSDIPTLPGVGYLDFARKAGEIAAGRKVQKIKNILWVSPLTVENSKPNEVLIELNPSGEMVQFEVYSEHEGKKQLYSQGKLYYSTKQDSEQESEYIDIESIRSRCSKVIDGKDAYPLFKSLGLHLGPSFQVLQEVYKNDTEVLGVLKIPDARIGDFDDYILHPSLVDGSFQAVMGAQLGGGAEGGMVVPYSLGEVEILHPLTKTCFSYVVDATNDKKSGAKLSKKNVLIVDEEGKILTRIRDSVGVPLTDVHEKPAEKSGDEFNNLYYSTVWEKALLTSEIHSQTSLDSIVFFDTDETLFNLYKKRLEHAGKDSRNVILVQPASIFEELTEQRYTIDPTNKNHFEQLFESINQKSINISNICFAWPTSVSNESSDFDTTTLDKSLEKGVYAFLSLCQIIIEKKLESEVQLQYLFYTKGSVPQVCNEAINGFAKILQAESPKLRCKIIEIQQQALVVDNQILDIVLSEYHPDTQDAMTIRYTNNERYERTIKRFDLDALGNDSSADSTPIKQKGVYIITGGAGGLGLIFAEYLAKEFKARLILTGRSSLSNEKEAQIAALKKLGAEVVYYPANVSVYEEVESLIANSKAQFGEINGIIHSAGVLRDSYVRNKTKEEMQAVFASKLYGTINLDRATEQEDIDFFVMFSSLAALAGNAGQSDYSFANHFMDSFASERQNLQQAGKRFGKTLSLNWSLWADGGMQLDEQTELFFRKNLGIKALAAETGIEAFIKGLGANKPSFAVIEGVQEKIEKAWGITKEEKVIAPVASATTSVSTDGQEAAGELTLHVQNELSEIVMEFLKLDAEDVDVETILLDLGFDSIGLTTFANAVNERYPLDVTPVLFFEYPNIREIAKYIAEEHPDEARQFHQIAASSSSSGGASYQPESKEQSAEKVNVGSYGISKGWNPNDVDTDATLEPVVNGISPELRFVQQPIAIVGASGVMPQSDDLDEYWNKLRNAENNMVTIIPEDRWSWEAFYGDPLVEENKTKSKWGGFMKEVDKFDPLFWGISPREAEMMDPQQRIFLETVWKAIEDSGQKVSDLAGTKTGLFVGASTRDYIDLMAFEGAELDGYSASGTSHAILANRVSFLLGFHGPSAPLDTACSSSLVALHRAIESIHTGSSDMAIVGGIQVMLTPAAFISFDAAGMLASDGKCKTFDNRADGYVRGEGSGAIFIKPLSMAEADGNHIYAVIKATAENHGGQATMLTAPNPNAQADLLVEAYEKAQIDPTSVGFIECHGTGTPLGDPIEIQAMKKAFSRLYKSHNKSPTKTPHIGLTSAKTNIGHLETAAGIAGILKVLLSIKHKEIPALLHFEKQNEYINLEGSPFYMVDKTQPWEAINREDGTYFPRRAGISSFGFGGANVHVILEEYQTAKSQSANQTDQPQLIILSAKYADRLKAYAQLMLEHLAKHQINLADFAYTLRVGRDEMPERLALVVSNVEELKQKLAAYVTNEVNNASFYQGNVGNRKAKSPSVALEISGSSVQTLIDQKDLEKLAELWVLGEEIDWKLFENTNLPQRLSLPTYPFARERYWFTGSAKKETEKNNYSLTNAGTENIHPLLHRNISTLKEQKFASDFTGQELYINDYAIGAQEVIPWSIYLEMVRVAGQAAGESSVKIIRDLVWKDVISTGNTTQRLNVSLVPHGEFVDARVISQNKKHVVTHFSAKLGYVEEEFQPDIIDISKLQKSHAQTLLTGEELYSALKACGLNLGKSFQTVEKINVIENQSLSILKLPKPSKGETDVFGLHPALMDGALQSVVVGIMNNNPNLLDWNHPFSVREIQIFNSLDEAYYAHGTWDYNSVQGEQVFPQINLQILDAKGKVLLRIKDLQMESLLQEKNEIEPTNKISLTDEVQARLQSFVPVWRPVAYSSIDQVNTPESTKILLLGDEQSQFDWLSKSFPASSLIHLPLNSTVDVIQTKLKKYDFEQLVWIAPNAIQKDLTQGFDHEQMLVQQEWGVLSLFRIIKALLHLEYRNKDLKLTVITANTQEVSQTEPFDPMHAGVWGFVGSLAKEYIQWKIRLLDLDSLEAVTASECLSLPWDNKGDGVTHRQGEWFNRGLASIDNLSSAESDPVYKHEGVYVVIGGAGGLGEVWTQFMVENYRAKIVWIGRREFDASIEEKIKYLQQFGHAPEYISADATNFEALRAALQSILKKHSVIHGVVHSAIVLQDQSIIQMDVSQFKASLSAKVDISVNMDRVFGELDLDFMLFFSSVISFMKTPGQSNYAAGCTFKDSFARHIQRKRSYPVKIMNWGYWGSVGVVADQSHNEIMKHLGIGSIEPQEGMRFLQLMLSSEMGQLALIKTYNTQFFERLIFSENIVPKDEANSTAKTPLLADIKTTSSTTSNSLNSTEVTDKMLQEYVQPVVVNMLSKALKLDSTLVRTDASFLDYGIDSIVGVNFIRTLNEALEIDLITINLFEYSSVEQLTQYIQSNWKDIIVSQLDLEKIELSGSDTVLEESSDDIETKVSYRFNKNSLRFNEFNAKNTNCQPIAIIGMSGRFSGSDNLDGFWKNLKEGRDSVHQVSRWASDECVTSSFNKSVYCSQGGFIDSIDMFDPDFFGISSKDARHMDPQQRLFLEESWGALENAGYANNGLEQMQCGIYVGCGRSGYDNLFVQETPAQYLFGGTESAIPSQVAQHLNLSGPAIAVDTGCSSSLVTVHLACQGLWSGETEMALAGGVSLQATPNFYQAANHAGMLSAKGRCYAFDSRADGFVPGEGVAVLALKRVQDALRDGDFIHGVIAASGVNQGGYPNNVVTGEMERAQERLVRSIYERFNIDPETIQLVEAHSNGNLSEDAVEHRAISRSFREYTNKKQFCALGSVKTNIGHAGAAAGVAGLMKALLSIKNKQIPPSLHFKQASSEIDLESSPFYVNTELREWKNDLSYPRRASVSAYGFSGTNAHLIIEEAPSIQQTVSESSSYLLTLSARTSEQLAQRIKDLLMFAKNSTKLSMNDLSYSLFVGRTHFNHRFSCIVASQEELIQRFDEWIKTGASKQVYLSEIKKVQEQVSLKNFGNHCLRQLSVTTRQPVENVEEELQFLETIADLYTQGYDLNFNLLFSNNSKRIPLPVYPFAKERYWGNSIDGEKTKPNGFNILIPMQTKGNASPIFAMPGAGGSVMSLQPLSRALGKKQPCYGLQAVGFDGKSEPLDSNEEIARANISALKKVQANGPYTFIGYSHGGVVAFEMARILLEQGEQVESLVLIDCLCPLYQVNDVVEELVEICNTLMRSLGASSHLDVEQLRKIPESERCEYLYNIMSAQGFHLNREQFTTSFNVSTANDRCNRIYKPSKLSKKIDVSLYRATDGYYNEMPDDFGWNEFLQEPIKVHDISANHLTIIDEEPIQEIVNSINKLSNKKKESEKLQISK